MLAIGLFEEAHGGADVTWLLWVALGFFALMVVVGWWSSRNKKEEEPVKAHHTEHGHAEDDLVSLEGIGPKVAKLLKEAGITTFAALAEANETMVQELLDKAGLQMMNPKGWIEQAKLAAQGDHEGLEKLQADLKGGRKA